MIESLPDPRVTFVTQDTRYGIELIEKMPDTLWFHKNIERHAAHTIVS